MNCPAARWKARRSRAYFLSAKWSMSLAIWVATISNGLGPQARQREGPCERLGIWTKSLPGKTARHNVTCPVTPERYFTCDVFFVRTRRSREARKLRKLKYRCRRCGPTCAGKGHRPNALLRVPTAIIGQSLEANYQARFFCLLEFPMPGNL